MLVEFRLRNFLSFRSEQRFTFVNSADRAHQATHTVKTRLRAVPSLSKAAVIFGPNASGKSNFIAALATLRSLVLESASMNEQQFAALYTPYLPSRGEERPIEFGIEVLLGEERYRYAIAYTSRRITFETLAVYKTAKAQRWFKRSFNETLGEEDWAQFSPNFCGPREMWRKATRTHALFLTTAGRLRCEAFKPLLHWFEHCLNIASGEAVATRDIAAQLRQPAHKVQLLRALNDLDIPARDVRVRDAQPQTDHPVIEFMYEYGPHVLWVDPQHEASGVRRLLCVLVRLLDAVRNEKLLVIDEFGTNLHPLVAMHLIGLVTGEAIGKNKTQLLLTAHNSALMDLNILRRDEIWLTGMDETRATELYRISERGARKQERVARSYLRGLYGAIPTIRMVG